MLGAIIGDIVGSAYEFNPTNDYNFEMFKDGSKFTDDTICTVAIADAILKGRDYGESLHEWCRKYMGPKGGYGARFRQWVESDDPQPYGSYGNGSAMRVSPIGMWWAGKPFNLKREATKSAACTHNHPEGIRGAVAIAQAIRWAVEYFDETLYQEMSEDAKRDFTELVAIGNGYRRDAVAEDYKNVFDETCQNTIPPAIDIIRRSHSFEDAIRRAVSLGADADTLGAIVGGIAEHIWGIPQKMKSVAMEYLTEEMRQVVNEFYRALEGRYSGLLKVKAERVRLKREKEERAWRKSCDRRMISSYAESYMKCSLAGTQYIKDQRVFGQIETDDPLTLKPEDNKHDPNAVAIYFKGIKIGYVPRKQNAELAVLAKQGWESMFAVFVDEIKKDVDKWEVRVEILRKYCCGTMPVDYDDSVAWWGKKMAHYIRMKCTRKTYEVWELWDEVYRIYNEERVGRYDRSFEEINEIVKFCEQHLKDEFHIAKTYNEQFPSYLREVSFRRLDEGAFGFNSLVVSEYNMEEQAQLYLSTGGRTGCLAGKMTPARIDQLDDGEVFVFGSNAQGHHIGGAARAAMERLGAEWGKGDGLHGKSYAISTMEGLVNTARNINRFIEFATRHQELKFFVTPIGCGIAGYTPLQIAPLFRKALVLPNVYLPRMFWEYYWQIEDQHPEFFQPDKAWEKWAK